MPAAAGAAAASSAGPAEAQVQPAEQHQEQPPEEEPTAEVAERRPEAAGKAAAAPPQACGRECSCDAPWNVIGRRTHSSDSDGMYARKEQACRPVVIILVNEGRRSSLGPSRR